MWSSSRYNVCKKSDAIEKIIFLIEKGEDYTVQFESGCYSGGAHGQGRRCFKCNYTGGKYWLVIKDGVCKLYNLVSDYPPKETDDDFIVIQKPVKNKYYTGAKQFTVKETTRYGIIAGVYDVQEETIDSFYFFYPPENQRRGVSKKEVRHDS